MDELQSFSPAARPQSSAPTRTRLPGSKNLKTNEWVLLHQHLLSRTMEHKDTVFVIHKKRFRPNDVRRKIRRAITSRKALWHDPGSLPPLPTHIELRSPSPEPAQLRTVGSALTNVDAEHLSQRQEEDLTFVRELSSQTIPDSENGESTGEEMYEETHRPRYDFLSKLLLSEFALPFCIPNWGSSQHPSRFDIVTAYGSVEARQEDSLMNLLDRLYDTRMKSEKNSPTYPEMTQTLMRYHPEHFSAGHFFETVVRALGSTAAQVLDWFYDDSCIRQHAGRAFGAAAYLNNFEAVDILIDNSADISGTVSRPHPHPECRCEVSVIEYTNLMRFGEQGQGPGDEMVAYLLGKGAKATGAVKCLQGLLDCLLRQPDSRTETFLHKVQAVAECIPGFVEVTCETESILETCVLRCNGGSDMEGRIQAFEYLLDQGAKTTPGSPLAALIYMEGPLELVEKLLRKSADVNAYCDRVVPDGRDLEATDRLHPFQSIHSVSPLQAAALRSQEETVRVLLNNRADVNCPARGSGGVTPLQGICFPKRCLDSEAAQAKKIRIAKLLLDRGANVNAAPAWNFGLTALQAAAFAGDLELVKLLVSRGANVNAPACKYGGGTALVMASREVHTDVVRYLLEVGAEVPASGAKHSSFGVTHCDHDQIMWVLKDSAPVLAAMGGASVYPPRDYHEYEAEWANDPSYESRGVLRSVG